MSVQGQFTNSACLNLFLKQGILLMVDSLNDFEITNTVFGIQLGAIWMVLPHQFKIANFQ